MTIRYLLVAFTIIQAGMFHFAEIPKISDAVLIFLLSVFLFTVAMTLYFWRPEFDKYR